MSRRLHSSCVNQSATTACLLVLQLIGIGLVASCAARDIVRGGDAPVSAHVAAVTRPHDQLWLVSCRSAGYLRRDDVLADLTYAQYRPNSGWTTTDQAQFEEDHSPSAITCLLVLGNGYTASDTRSMGHTIYQRLAAGLPVETPVRFVIWSWPSDHIDAGPIKDLRTKASRTTNVAWCLARWLEEVPSDYRLSFLGTSFGARIVMEALELRGGGQLSGLSLEIPSRTPRQKANVVLISSAIDSDWLLPGGRLAGAVTQANHLLLVNNTSDSVLKRYHWLYGARSKTSAVGSTGLRRAAPGEIVQIDAAPIIGRRHGCAPYFDSPRLLAEMRAVLFDDAVRPPTVPADGLQIPVAVKEPAQLGDGKASERQ